MRIRYEVRKKDNPGAYLGLQIFAKLNRTPVPRGISPTPSVSLLWYNLRIRGINRKLRHDVVQNGIVVGTVRGWHEHQWTDADEDKFVIDVNALIKKSDLRSLLQFCMKRWNIEFPEQLTLE